MLDVIAAPENRLLVLIGEPGSGKSTLMRYLLTGVLEPPVDQSGAPLSWTATFKDAFPLLIELRDFHALRRSHDCDSFLEYVAYMGKTDHWFLDDHAINAYLEDTPSVVMFDGLDEIFDAADRDRLVQEIVGFAERYPRTRVIVTSRPIGYKEHALRSAGFVQFGIQDLNDPQIEAFIGGWFKLTFPLQTQQAIQRSERVLTSVQNSSSIRLLAGNPMLLTIMALLAREDELPRERAKFYEKAVEVLCHHWDANRHLELPKDTDLNAADKRLLLQRLAMRMQTGSGGLKGNVILEEELEKEIQSYLAEEWKIGFSEARVASRRMIQQLRERNYILCLRGPGLYGFLHRTFLEYLTAAEYVRRFDRQPQQMNLEELMQLFQGHCLDDEWREVLLLICGQIDEQFSGSIIDRLVSESPLDDLSDDLHRILLAVRCLGEVRNGAKIADTIGRLLETLIRVFFLNRSALPERRYGLIGRLVRTVEEVPVDWPRTPSLENAPTIASDYWSQMEWPRFLAAVTKNRNDVEALIVTPSWVVRDSALRVIADRWPDQRSREMVSARLLNDRDGVVQSTAIETLASVWPDDESRLVVTRLLTDDASLLRTTAVAALAANWPDAESYDLLVGLASQDDSDSVVGAAIQALNGHWGPNPTTDALLRLQSRVNDTAAWVLAEQHSLFGSLVFSRDCDGMLPYVDPQEPIQEGQISQAAIRADLEEAAIAEMVASLSAHMGWDIRRGSSSS